jgi:two-component system NarL family response regulator/two-component system response regulator DevR
MHDCHSPVILVVDSDILARRRAARLLSVCAIVRPAGSLAAARASIREVRPAAMVVDPRLPDGDGLDLVEEARVDNPGMPVLVVTALATARDASRACTAGASFLGKDESRTVIEARLLELAHSAQSRQNLREGLAWQLATRHRLTPAETETVLVFVRVGSREALAPELGIAETSVRSRVRGACRKLGIPRLDAIYGLLFERAIERLEHTGRASMPTPGPIDIRTMAGR